MAVAPTDAQRLLASSAFVFLPCMGPFLYLDLLLFSMGKKESADWSALHERKPAGLQSVDNATKSTKSDGRPGDSCLPKHIDRASPKRCRPT